MAIAPNCGGRYDPQINCRSRGVGGAWATSKNVAEAVLSRRPGVLEVEAKPVAQTATVTYDPSRSSVAELAGWVRDCESHCAEQSVPDDICDPLAEPAATAAKHDHHHITHHAPRRSSRLGP
jgi:copper chaperone CopZ